MERNYVYLLQKEKYVKTGENVYKIGRTKRKNFKRFNNYTKGSELLFQKCCIDCYEMENLIIEKFKKKFIHRSDIGREYFEGDCVSMMKKIEKYTNKEYEVYEQNKEIISRTCKYCDIVFKSIKKLNKHNENECIKVYKCKKCDDFFKSKKELKKHEIKKCIGLIRCNLCEHIFYNKRGLKEHQNMKYPCNKNYELGFECLDCNNCFSNIGNLNRHKKNNCPGKNNIGTNVIGNKIKKICDTLVDLIYLPVTRLKLIENYIINIETILDESTKYNSKVTKPIVKIKLNKLLLNKPDPDVKFKPKPKPKPKHIIDKPVVIIKSNRLILSK